MQKDKVRVVLVGAGGYGRIYLEEILTHDTGAELVGVCDIDPLINERLPIIREKQIPVYPDLDAFFAASSAELAVLVSPVHFHTDMVLTCLAHGTNVLCEKPLCLSAGEAQLMREAAQKAHRFLAVGYQINYRRDLLALKADILAGRFGRPVRASAYHGFRRGMNYYTRNNWAGHIVCGGREVFDSPFTNACAHHFQMLTFLLGDDMCSACGIDRAEAELYRANPHIENYDVAALRFQANSGVPILYYTAHPIRSEFWGPVGVLEFEEATISYFGEKPVFRGVMKNGTAFDYDAVAPGGNMQKLADAIRAVRTGQTPVCGIDADLPHIQAVRMVQKCPIVPVRSELVECVQAHGDTFFFVRDLERILAHCAGEWALPSELGIFLGR